MVVSMFVPMAVAVVMVMAEVMSPAERNRDVDPVGA